MEKENCLHRILAPAIVLLVIFFASCIIDPIGPISQPQPIDYTPEVNDPVTNDFTMVKACIGLTKAPAETILNNNGFISNGERYVKTENNVTKNLSISGVIQAEKLLSLQTYSAKVKRYRNYHHYNNID